MNEHVFVASDAVPFTFQSDKAVGHPRTSGCFSRFLRTFVREQNNISLVQALRKMTLQPCQVGAILSHTIAHE